MHAELVKRAPLDALWRGLITGPLLCNCLPGAVWRPASVVVTPMGAPPGAKLSPRESQVLRHIAAGDCNKHIAGSLGLSPHAVKRSGVAPSGSAPLRIRHYPRDHSVFVNDQYLIKGVAGAIVAKLVRDQIASGRDAFNTRELRLAGGDLRLPDVQDNLGVRLLLLERRLTERDFGLRIERNGRGHYRLIANGPLEILSA